MSDDFKQFLFLLTLPENKRKVYHEVFALSDAEQERWEVLLFERRKTCRVNRHKQRYRQRPDLGQENEKEAA